MIGLALNAPAWLDIFIVAINGAMVAGAVWNLLNAD